MRAVRCTAAALKFAFLGAIIGCHSGPGAMSAASCPSIDEYCQNGNPDCVRDWATASQPSRWCIRGGQSGIDGSAGTGNADVYILPGCDGFNVVWLRLVDSGTIYLYDIGTGQLTGIVAAGSDSCLAGTLPASPVLFTCADASVAPVCGPGQSG
jgi:hypothetical protein